MSEASVDCQYPEWLAPGSSVTTIKGRDEVTRETTVERVGKRDVVLANGERFSLTSLRGDKVLRRRGRGTWDPSDLLVPTTSERARTARAAEWRRHLIAKARRACEAIDKALANGDLTAVEDHHQRLSAALYRLAETQNSGSRSRADG